MNKLKHSIPPRILHTLYCTLILTYLSYGILIRGNTCKSYLDKVVKLQKWAIITVSNSHYRSHTGPLFSTNNLLTVTYMYLNFECLCLNTPLMIFLALLKTLYPTRHVNDFNLTKNKKAFSDHAIRTRGLVLWNSLSKSLRDSKSVKHFRK